MTRVQLQTSNGLIASLSRQTATIDTDTKRVKGNFICTWGRIMATLATKTILNYRETLVVQVVVGNKSPD